VLSTPLNDTIDPLNHLRGQNGLVISLSGRDVNVSGDPGSLCFLSRGELPLPRNEEIFVLPFGVAGELGVDLNKLPPLRLEVVDCRTLKVLLQPIKVHKLLHCEVMLLAQSHGPQNHTPEESSPGVGR
jgi:hypothetical protein